MRRTTTTLFFLIFALILQVEGRQCADISFLLIDFKYTKQHGVKICEMQPGMISMFKGYDYINNDVGLVSRNFWDLFGSGHENFWYYPTNVTDPLIREQLNKHGAIALKSPSDLYENPLLISHGKQAPENPYALTDYRGILIASHERITQTDRFNREYPGILLLDQAFYPYFNSKALMSTLFSGEEQFLQLKPRWNQFQKGSSEHHINAILEYFDSDYLVLKPHHAAKGYGVLIIHRDELKKTLKYIFGNKNKLSNDKDRSYQYWSRDSKDSFIVEEFLESDPLKVPDNSNKRFDPTGRITFFLTYNCGVPEIHYIGLYWKLPDCHLDGKGSFNEKHKSSAKGGNFCKIDANTQFNIEEQLRKTIPWIYERVILSQS